MKKFIVPSVLLLSAIALVSFSNEDENIDATVDSSVALLKEDNTYGKMDRVHLTDKKNTTNTTLKSSKSNSVGLLYDPIKDSLTEVSRSKNNVLVFENIDPVKIDPVKHDFALASTLGTNIEVKNARDIAVSGNRIVVSSEASSPTDSNRFYVYESTGNSLSLTKVFETDSKHLGIFIDDHTLYAIIANSNSIAVYNNIFDKADGLLTADDVFVVEGANSLRGVTYDQLEDTLFLTDVGDPSNDRDDAVITINHFSVKYGIIGSYGVLAAADTKKITGSKSMMGIPVDVEYDNIGKVLYAAGRNTSGFMPSGFTTTPTLGDVAPKMKQSSSGTSGIYLNVE